MPNPTAQFNLDISKWVAKAKGAGKAVAVETIQDINEAIVQSTPVVTGNLRRSWHASINQTPSGTPGSQANPAAIMNLVAQGLEIGDTYIAGNVAAYARRVEYGFVGTDSLGRSYNQSGRHTVQAVMNRANQIAATAAARVAARSKGSI